MTARLRVLITWKNRKHNSVFFKRFYSHRVRYVPISFRNRQTKSVNSCWVPSIQIIRPTIDYNELCFPITVNRNRIDFTIRFYRLIYNVYMLASFIAIAYYYYFISVIYAVFHESNSLFSSLFHLILWTSEMFVNWVPPGSLGFSYCTRVWITIGSSKKKKKPRRSVLTNSTAQHSHYLPIGILFPNPPNNTSQAK